LYPLADPGWVAVHTAIEEDIFWESIEKLRGAGATEIRSRRSKSSALGETTSCFRETLGLQVTSWSGRWAII
jgi:hypothetical protein